MLVKFNVQESGTFSCIFVLNDDLFLSGWFAFIEHHLVHNVYLNKREKEIVLLSTVLVLLKIYCKYVNDYISKFLIKIHFLFLFLFFFLFSLFLTFFLSFFLAASKLCAYILII